MIDIAVITALFMEGELVHLTVPTPDEMERVGGRKDIHLLNGGSLLVRKYFIQYATVDAALIRTVDPTQFETGKRTRTGPVMRDVTTFTCLFTCRTEPRLVGMPNLLRVYCH